MGRPKLNEEDKKVIVNISMKKSLKEWAKTNMPKGKFSHFVEDCIIQLKEKLDNSPVYKDVDAPTPTEEAPEIEEENKELL